MSYTLTDLASLWPISADEPHAVFEGSDPPGQAGTYVIEPGERVPESGTTSHAGAEVSVILEGSLRIVVDGDERRIGPDTLSVIEPGVEHYSENDGDEPVRLVYAVFGDL